MHITNYDVVRVLRLVCENSIEERILARANFKLDIDAKIIQAGKFDNKSSAQDRRDMLEFLMAKEEGKVLVVISLFWGFI